jgi:hypothetical protein
MHMQKQRISQHREERFEGRAADMRKSPWLASEDLDGAKKDVLVTIEDVMRHENATFDEGRTEPRVFSLKFAGKEKQMILNATNRKVLARAFGMKTANWRGQTVALYVDPRVRFGGKTVKGLRIRIPGTVPSPNRSEEDLISEEEAWAEAKGGERE